MKNHRKASNWPKLATVNRDTIFAACWKIFPQKVANATSFWEKLKKSHGGQNWSGVQCTSEQSQNLIYTGETGKINKIIK